MARSKEENVEARVRAWMIEMAETAQAITDWEILHLNGIRSIPYPAGSRDTLGHAVSLTKRLSAGWDKLGKAATIREWVTLKGRLVEMATDLHSGKPLTAVFPSASSARMAQLLESE